MKYADKLWCRKIPVYFRVPYRNKAFKKAGIGMNVRNLNQYLKDVFYWNNLKVASQFSTLSGKKSVESCKSSPLSHI